MLNKFHPFRASVADRTSASSAPAPAPAPGASAQTTATTATPTSQLSLGAENTDSGKGDEENEHSLSLKLFFALGRKTRLGLFLIVGLIICVGYQSLYDVMSSSESNALPVVLLGGSQDVSPSRSVEDARSSAGFLRRIFCKGAQRASFCR